MTCPPHPSDSTEPLPKTGLRGHRVHHCDRCDREFEAAGRNDDGDLMEWGSEVRSLF